eukprot:8188904-Pyramimonas_sp.AAC.1
MAACLSSGAQLPAHPRGRRREQVSPALGRTPAHRRGPHRGPRTRLGRTTVQRGGLDSADWTIRGPARPTNQRPVPRWTQPAR